MSKPIVSIKCDCGRTVSEAQELCDMWLERMLELNTLRAKQAEHQAVRDERDYLRTLLKLMFPVPHAVLVAEPEAGDDR